MNKERYLAAVGYFSDNQNAYRFLWFIYKVLPNVLFIAYPILLVTEFFIMGVNMEWANLAIVPFFVLITVSVLRLAINEQRPYEKYGTDSVFHKKTVGKSMPSRHTASAYILAMTFLAVNIPLGIIALVIATLIAASRILAGAHFIRDVLVGAAFGIGFGLLYFSETPLWTMFSL